MSARFGFIPVASVLQNETALNQLVTHYAPGLEALGGQLLSPASIGLPAPLLYFVGTGGTERKVLELWKKRQAASKDNFVILIAHPGNNSLPASLEILARLQQDGVPGQICYLSNPYDELGLRQVNTTVHDLETYRALQYARIGLVGQPSDWLVASTPTPEAISEHWGPEVIPVSMESLYDQMQQVTDEQITPYLEKLQQRAKTITEPTQDDLVNAVRVYVALKAVVDNLQLSALTLRCFDLVIHHKTTGCFALAQLNEEGIIAGCEGDLVSTLGMLWAYKLLGRIPWMANPAQLDVGRNTLVLAHCTVPPSSVNGYTLRSHFESGLGVSLQGDFPLGPVTLLRIGSPSLDKIWLAEGHIQATGKAENLCRTQIHVELTLGHVSELLHAPLGNHLVVVPGHYAKQFKSWWEIRRKV
ncbi:MAG: fucose isomerase [Anaerolineae bacterium]|nr:fucose isomerase [Anaerolineae bacterium]